MILRTRIPNWRVGSIERRLPRSRTRSFLVYYDGGLESAAALRAACEMADAKTKITALYLEVFSDSRELDEELQTMRATAILAGAIVNAQIRGVAIATETVRCRSKGPALVARAAQDHATIFLGVEESARPNTFAEYVLALAPAQVLLVRTNSCQNSECKKLEPSELDEE